MCYRWFRLAPVVLALAGFSPWVMAAGQDTSPEKQALPSIQTKLKKAQSQVLGTQDDDRITRMSIAERANNTFTLLASEMVLNQGDAASALAAYMVMLERTRAPEVAERGMEIALSFNAIAQAEALLDRWRALEPTPSAAQKRMEWEMAVAKGHVPAVVAGLDAVLNHADEYRARRIFLQMAQMAIRQPEVVAAGAAPIHRAAARYPDMAEAMMADAIFSAQNGRTQDAVGALQRLAAFDADIRPATQLTLSLISQRQPQVLTSFFKQSDISSLSSMWQGLYVDTLINSGQLEQAYTQLQHILASKPDADFYIQAGFLSVNQKAPRTQTLDFLEKAYGLGTQEQKSKAAFLAATRLMDDNDADLARAWAMRISAPDMQFDKWLLLASIELAQHNAAAAGQALARAEAVLPQAGRFYDAGDLWRMRLYTVSQQKQPAQALAAYQRLLSKAEKAPQDPEKNERIAAVLYQRGLLYADDLRQPQRAVEDLRRYVALNPHSAAGLNALGYTMLSLPRSQWAEATKLIEEAYALESQSPAINDSLGWAYYLQGDAEKALPYLQFAFEQLPEGEVAAHLGEVLWSLQRQDEAKAIWQQGLIGSPKDRVLLETLKRLGVGLPKSQ